MLNIVIITVSISFSASDLATDTTSESMQQPFDPLSVTQPPDGEDDCEDDQVITSTAPAKEIVDTVVKLTTNPDGTVKRTTYKTTHRVITTTTVRRIRAKKPPENPQSSPGSALAICASASTGNNPNDDNYAQATFTFIPPTQVCYEETNQSDTDVDPETTKELFGVGVTDNRPVESTDDLDASAADSTSIPKARAKTTVRKTVTASAATATFVGKGMLCNLQKTATDGEE